MAFMVNVKPTGVEVAFEVGSVAEAVEALANESNALHTLMGIKFNVTDDPATATAAPEQKPRKPRKGPDPSTASAPPPAPVPAPAPAPPAPVPVPGTGFDGPAFLDRNAPAPPPLVAVPPPTLVPCELARKAAVEFQRRAAGAVDGGKAMLEWAYSTGLVMKGATVQEATDVLEMQTEDKIRPVAAALGVG